MPHLSLTWPNEGVEACGVVSLSSLGTDPLRTAGPFPELPVQLHGVIVQPLGPGQRQMNRRAYLVHSKAGKVGPLNGQQFGLVAGGPHADHGQHHGQYLQHCLCGPARDSGPFWCRSWVVCWVAGFRVCVWCGWGVADLQLFAGWPSLLAGVSVGNLRGRQERYPTYMYCSVLGQREYFTVYLETDT